jgi:hypothetical protein
MTPGKRPLLNSYPKSGMARMLSKRRKLLNWDLVRRRLKAATQDYEVRYGKAKR